MSAQVNGRLYPDLPGCEHCGAPVQTTNFALGPKVEHYDPAASYRDSVWWHCRLSVATLPGAPPVAVSADLVTREGQP